MTDTAEKLLPCPFCGSSAQFGRGDGTHYVWCPGCDSYGALIRTTDRVAGRGKAKAMWNLRAADARVETLTQERDSFRAVLAGAGYGAIDRIAQNSTDQSLALGEAVKAMTMSRIQQAEAAEAENARLRELLAGAAQDAMRALLSVEITDDMIEEIAEAYHTALETARENKRAAYRSLGKEPTENIRLAPLHWIPAVARAVIRAVAKPEGADNA